MGVEELGDGAAQMWPFCELTVDVRGRTNTEIRHRITGFYRLKILVSTVYFPIRHATSDNHIFSVVDLCYFV